MIQLVVKKMLSCRRKRNSGKSDQMLHPGRFVGLELLYLLFKDINYKL